MNSFGNNFRITIFGESHGEALGVVIDGTPAGIPLSVADFEADLARRRSSGMPGTTPRRESDTPEIVSGLHNGHTTGAPLTVLFRNENTRSGDYSQFAQHPRPSHADLVAARKFGGHNDPRGGGHFSGRVTLGLVAAGVVAKKILGTEVRVASEIIEIGGSRNPADFEGIIAAAMHDRDSVGGVIECRATGVPAGLGEPFFDSIESVASHLLFSIPGVKGVEFGSGFEGARRRGSQNNDPITDALGTTATNNSGGIDGGITNGNEIVARVAVKPTASIGRPQQTWNFATGRVETLEIGGRHDACIALRAAVVVEAALAIALADAALLRR
ncbi:MAG: chorismate synthase [Alistipes sp.]|jgi:chorismate synthase|nr:chorismate synthase [Alistipes sp.]